MSASPGRGGGLTAFRLGDVPEAIRLRAAERILRGVDPKLPRVATFVDRLAVGAASERPRLLDPDAGVREDHAPPHQEATMIENRSNVHQLALHGIGAVSFVYRHGGRTKLEEEGRCRLCLRPSRVRRLTRHHLVPQRWFALRGSPIILRDCDANIVPLCRPCHDWIEIDEEGRRMLRNVLGSAEAGFAVRLLGLAWFDERYPSARAGRPVEGASVAAAPVADPAGRAAA